MKVLPKAENARNYTQCDSMLVGNQCGAHTFPYIEVGNNTATVEHEASTSKIGEDQIFYLKQRGLSSAEQAVSMIVSGFCKEVFKELPMEFALEAQQLLGHHAGRFGRIEPVRSFNHCLTRMNSDGITEPFLADSASGRISSRSDPVSSGG